MVNITTFPSIFKLRSTCEINPNLADFMTRIDRGWEHSAEDAPEWLRTMCPEVEVVDHFNVFLSSVTPPFSKEMDSYSIHKSCRSIRVHNEVCQVTRHNCPCPNSYLSLDKVTLTLLANTSHDTNLVSNYLSQNEKASLLQTIWYKHTVVDIAQQMISMDIVC